MMTTGYQGSNTDAHPERRGSRLLGEAGSRPIVEGEVVELISKAIVRHVAGDFQVASLPHITLLAS